MLYLWSGGHVERLFPGFESIAADLYWLRTVQYFGAERRFAREKRFDLLRPLIEITTDLDPRLEVAYRYGAIFLAERAPEGAGRPREAIEVLEKGVRTQPALLAPAAGPRLLPLPLPARRAARVRDPERGGGAARGGVLAADARPPTSC